MQRQLARHPPLHNLLPHRLPRLAARKVALFARHDAARVDDVEERESDEHEGGVEDVLIRFVDGDTGAVAVGVLD